MPAAPFGPGSAPDAASSAVPAVPVPRFTPFAALRHRNFRLFYTGQTLSLIGTWMQTLAQGWLVLELTNSAFWVGLVAFLGSLPIVLFTLPAGVYVDRSHKRRIITICQSLMLVQALVLTALTALRRIEAWEVAVLAVLLGCFQAIEIPARQSFFVELVDRENLTNAIALNSSAFNASRIIGPAIAGVLVARVGMAWCFGLNALSYVAVLIGLARMRLPAFAPPAMQGNDIERFKEGIRFVRSERRVFALVLSIALLSLFGFPYLVLLPVFARDQLHVGAEGLGVMSASVGIGAVASALWLAAVAMRTGRGRIVAIAGPSFGIAVALFALSRSFPLALLMLAATGFAMVLNNAAINTLIQHLVSDDLRGRVMSVWTFVFVGFSPIGALWVGWLAGLIGAPLALAASGLISALSVAWLWWR
ncbi:MAG: MFS transporter, partial [Gemmatimonadales bacterium]